MSRISRPGTIDLNGAQPRLPALRSKLRHVVGQSLRSAPTPVMDLARRGATRFLAAVGPYQLPTELAGDAPLSWESHPVPIPDGLSLADVEKSFRSWSVNGEPVGHLDGYVDDSIWRFLHTWGMLRYDTGSCLELGANPYFTTYLLEEHTKLQLTLANYYGQRGETTETVSFVPPLGTSRAEKTRQSRMFNVEEDEFPFDAHSFDIVLFCEMLEHLLMDPLAVLRQIHRILKPNGVLVLTTPNVCRLNNVLAMVDGANIYDPYSGFGPYGRHNREYTRHELHHLLDFAGFDAEYSLTADGHASRPIDQPRHEQAASLVDFRRSDLGQYLFVRARAARPPRNGLPSFLYRSRPEGEIVPFDV